MAKLIYSAITSLDGYTADEEGNFDGLRRTRSAQLRKRSRAAYWHPPLRTPDVRDDALLGDHAHLPDQPAFIHDFAELWRVADKIVYSKELKVVSSAGTRIERSFDPGAVRQMKSTAGRDISVGGADPTALTESLTTLVSTNATHTKQSEV